LKSEITWRGSRLTFDSKIRQHEVIMDTKTVNGGADQGASPKELLLAALCGCAGMDVVGLMRKARAELQTLVVTAEAETTDVHPKIFKEVQLVFAATGDPSIQAPLIDAVRLSESLYCGVGAMVAKACPISYQVTLNGATVATGHAEFP